MSPPRFQDCICGHRGAQHHDTGQCARCDCAKFKHPTASYAIAIAFPQGKRNRNSRKGYGSGSHQTRDARP